MGTETQTDKFIDYVNYIMVKENITKAHLARELDMDKNSIGNYLLKHTNIPMYAAIKIAIYLKLDISKICGIPTEETLSPMEKELIRETRKVDDVHRAQLIMELINIAKIFNSK